jgi:hypothetical protein
MEYNDNLDEMMNDVAINFLDIPKVFKILLITIIYDILKIY